MSHDAAILNKRGAKLVVTQRPTPSPGPDEVVISVKNIALNPVDHVQQSMGFNISGYPYVLGFDVAGTIHAVGPSVTGLRVGDRVTASASSWFSKLPDYGAFQQFVLVKDYNVAPIPDSVSFVDACMLPLAIYTAWYGILLVDVPRTAAYQPSDKKGILLWGVGGSVGSVALQIARSLGLYVYATASSKHHTYLQSLGKGSGKLTLFDYKDADVVKKIVQAAKDDGVALELGVETAAGNLGDMIRILNKTKPSGTTAKIACAPFSLSQVWYSSIVPSFLSGVHVTFVKPPNDNKQLASDLSFFYNKWLPEKLASGDLVPSPKPKLAPNGLEGIQSALEELKGGVSGVKIVLEL